MEAFGGFVIVLLIGVPLIYWAVRFAWFLVRTALILSLALIAMVGAAWRGEIQ